MTPDDDAPASVEADYFDGRSAQAHRVRLRVGGDRLLIEGDGLARAEPLARLRWPERTRHGVRMMHLHDGASLHCRDAAGWDAWSAAAAGRRDSLVVRWQQRWRWVGASLALLVALAGAGYRWGLPWAAAQLVAVMPASIDRAVGEAGLESADAQHLLKPSTLTAGQQAAIRASFAAAVARLPAGSAPAYRLEFRKSDIGPDAFALPGGTIVVLDDLVRRVNGDHDILVGVLGHELGHLRHRHGMRMLVQAGALGAAAAAFYGDFSTLLASVPVWLGQAAYSRDAEREADQEAVEVLRANAISPAVMVRFFALMREPAPGDKPAAPQPRMPIALASHPADAERIAFFERAAQGS